MDKACLKKFKITSFLNGMVITVSEGQHKTKPGNLLLELYEGKKQQQFYIEPVSAGEYKISSVAQPTRVLDVTGQSKEVYREIILYQYHGNSNQKWMITPIDKEKVQITSSWSQLVLQVQGGIDAEGMAVVQNTNYKNKSQIWRLEPV